jgi:hypothetical protein
MSDASRHTVYFIEEATFGVTPAGALTKLRNTGTTLGLSKSFNVSAELNENRQISDGRHGTKQVGGDINFELSYGGFDPLLEAAFLGAWSPRGLLDDDTISAATADDSYNDSANGFVLAGFKVGDVITVAGFDEAGNNGRRKILTLAAGKITVAAADGSAVNLIDEIAGDEISITSDAEILRAGVETRSFTIVRHFTDIAEADDPIHIFRGVMLNNLSLNLSPDAMVTGSFSCIGQSMEVTDVLPVGNTFGTANANRVFDGFTGSILEGGVTNAIATELSLTLENGISPRFVLFSDETITPQIGQSNLTGSVSMFFENSVMVNKFINETSSSLKLTLTDLEANSYIIDIPRITYTGGQPDVSGPGSITLSMPLQALYDSVTDTNLGLTRIPKVA